MIQCVLTIAHFNGNSMIRNSTPQSNPDNTGIIDYSAKNYKLYCKI